MVVCAVFIPHEQVRESLILTTVAFVILIAFLFYSLSWDAELASAYFKQFTIVRAKGAVRGAAEGSENSSEQTVASRVVGITGVRLLDEESFWTIQPWVRPDDGLLPPDPVVLRIRK